MNFQRANKAEKDDGCGAHHNTIAIMQASLSRYVAGFSNLEFMDNWEYELGWLIIKKLGMRYRSLHMESQIQVCTMIGQTAEVEQSSPSKSGVGSKANDYLKRVAI